MKDPAHYHQHADLQHGRAEYAAVYPEQLCYSVLKGLRNEMKQLGIQQSSSLGSICEDPEEHMFTQELHQHDSPMYDDVSGKALLPRLVAEARADEIRGVVSHNVWTKCSVSECRDKTGRPPVKGRWVDINKGDDHNPNYRSRYVGREFRGKDNRDDLFAATPPIEAIKMLISLAASQKGIRKNIKKLMFIDVSKAYFHAPAQRSVYVELPDEALEAHERGGHICGRLNFSLYGTRDAAQNWELAYTQFLTGLGFIRGLSSPCIFAHKSRDLQCVVHGDDFTILGEDGSLKWLSSEFHKIFKIKVRGILGPDPQDTQQITLLNRVLSWDTDGIRCEADQRHAEILLKTLGYESVKGVVTPGIQESEKDLTEEDDIPLGPKEASLYRAGAARCNFLGIDRPDIQYSAKEISRAMSSPTQGSLRKLHRLARYLKQYPRAVYLYRHQIRPDRINVYSDSNWAGCLRTRKSTQGGAVMHGSHCVKNWSSTQAIIALSSGEAEYYGLVKASSVGLGCKALLKDVGIDVSLHVHTDAEAAKGIASRTGLGKTRHIAVHFLWVQERVRSKDLILHKVLGLVNPADLLTKYLPSPTITKLMELYGFSYSEGRHPLTPHT